MEPEVQKKWIDAMQMERAKEIEDMDIKVD